MWSIKSSKEEIVFRASRIKYLGTCFFCAPNNMFAYMIVYLTFCAPRIVVRADVYANIYLAVHLLQIYKYFRVEGRLKVYKVNPEPSPGIQTVFYRERNNRQVSCLHRTKQSDFPSTVFVSNEHGQSFPEFVGLRQ